MNVNLDKYFDDQKPTITVNGKEYEVDNDYRKVMGFMQMKDKLGDDESVESLKKMVAYGLVGGKKTADEIFSQKFSFQFLTHLIIGMAACMTGQSMESLEAQMGSTFPEQ